MDHTSELIKNMNEEIVNIIKNALKEDMPMGDITTDNIIPENHNSIGKFIAKEDGIIAGVAIANEVFNLAGGNVNISWVVKDGDFVKKGEIIATLNGNTRTLLHGERTALNIMQRMSGIATFTNQCVKACVGKTRILDTRKTMPNLRILDKQAVVIGGGKNHRYCLSDMVLIKDNHIEAAGSIKEAVRRVQEKVSCDIEVEVETIEQFLEAMNTKCSIIMLDNMSDELMKKCVEINAGKKLLEASGNMTLERIKTVSSLGVDYISLGALTHSVKALDISLKFKSI